MNETMRGRRPGEFEEEKFDGHYAEQRRLASQVGREDHGGCKHHGQHTRTAQAMDSRHRETRFELRGEPPGGIAVVAAAQDLPVTKNQAAAAASALKAPSNQAHRRAFRRRAPPQQQAERHHWRGSAG